MLGQELLREERRNAPKTEPAGKLEFLGFEAVAGEDADDFWPRESKRVAKFGAGALAGVGATDEPGVAGVAAVEWGFETEPTLETEPEFAVAGAEAEVPPGAAE